MVESRSRDFETDEWLAASAHECKPYLLYIMVYSVSLKLKRHFKHANDKGKGIAPLPYCTLKTVVLKNIGQMFIASSYDSVSVIKNHGRFSKTVQSKHDIESLS